MTTLILCRHGRTDWNDAGRYQGQTDVPLNEQGLGQALSLSQQLRNRQLDAVYSSALQRAYRTADEIARPHSLGVVTDARLNEINQGLWEGLLTSEIAARYRDLFPAWATSFQNVRPPDGESYEEVRVRALVALREIVARHPLGAVCVVTHRVVLLTLLESFGYEGLAGVGREAPANGAVIEVPIDAATMRAVGPAAIAFHADEVERRSAAQSDRGRS